MMDILVMDRINVSFVHHHIQSVKIIQMIGPNASLLLHQVRIYNINISVNLAIFIMILKHVNNVIVHAKLANQIRITDQYFINVYIKQVGFLILMVLHASNAKYHVLLVQIQQINVLSVKTQYINNLNFVYVNLDGYLMTIISVYLVYNHIKLVKYLHLNV
ncbi:unnamed protein product [Paramecium sonneborni]|uniref:Transmembrane protein n=1 Tax=Paramecium sonneborni TaxID=65129 RepID=A0A8S1PMG6_9CILI|nr:unnamed protein product [Paramecium sonneborni]